MLIFEINQTFTLLTMDLINTIFIPMGFRGLEGQSRFPKGDQGWLGPAGLHAHMARAAVPAATPARPWWAASMSQRAYRVSAPFTGVVAGLIRQPLVLGASFVVPAVKSDFVKSIFKINIKRSKKA